MSSKKVLFLYLGTENIGVETLSAYLKSKGHEVELLLDPALFSGFVVYNNKLLSGIFDSNSEKALRKAIAGSKPDLVCFSVFTGNYIWALKWAGICKEIYPDTPVVFGGIHPTSVPDEVIGHDFVDAVVVGEGEDALAEMLAGLEGGRLPQDVKNTVVKRDGNIITNPVRPYIRNLDDYPILDKELFYNKIPGLEECYLAITSRGCPYRCTYCGNNILHKIYGFEKNHIRRRSVDHVIKELEIVKKRGKAKNIFFVDDVFIFNKDWLAEFAAKYKEKIGIPFWCTAYPTAVNETVVRLLKEAGCWLITMGVQSGSPRIREKVFHRMESNKTIAAASRMIMDSGIILGLDNIFGAPTESEEDLRESLELYSMIRPQRIHTFWLTYFPRMAILDKALEAGEISDRDIKDLERGYVGQCDFGGTVKRNVGMYLKYEFLCHFLSLVGYNNGVRRFLLRRKNLIPKSAVINKLLIILNAIKNGDIKFFYLIRSLFFKRNVP